VLPDGTRDILGLWIEGTEGAKFWMKVFNDLKTRGVNDILIAVTDGLKGMPTPRTRTPIHCPRLQPIDSLRIVDLRSLQAHT
jgi:transposase-like protein